MPAYDQPKQLSDVIKWEGNALYCRERVVVAQNQTLEIGTVLGRVTASGQVVPADPSAADGSQTPIGILCERVVTGAGQTAVSYAIARLAIASLDGLVYGAGVTTPERATLQAGLTALGIVLRDGV